MLEDRQVQSSFRGIVAQPQPLSILKQQLKRGKLTHAYLFVGPQGVGKETIAQRFILYLLGLDHLSQIKTHPDILMIKSRGEVKIAAVRAIKRFLMLKPYAAPLRIVLVLNAEKMTREAANALLKVLEEPQGDSMLILTARAGRAVLSTIASRCQILRFHRVPHKLLVHFLRERGAKVKQAAVWARLGEGYPGRALRYLQRPSLLGEEKVIGDAFLALKKQDLATRFHFAEQHFQNKQHLQKILRGWSRLLHHVLLLKMGCPECLSPIINKQELHSLQAQYQTGELISLLRMIQRLESRLKSNLNRRLALESLLLNI